MSPHQSKKKIPIKKRYPEEEEWDYIEETDFKKSRSTCVCLTCQYFDFSYDRYCRTLLFCHIKQRLIPHGEHLNSRCPLWHQRVEKEFNSYPKAA